MGTHNYYDKLARMSLPELQAELQSELDALNELHSGPRYDDWSRQLSETKENIRVIKECMARKRGS